jgi:DNA polymerase-4
MHLDMNSYFASVEQQDNLAWRGLPVGVCEHLGGIIIAASVEAKKWGIKTGTPVWEARKLYPKIILTPTRLDRYRFYNRRMVKVVSDYSSEVEIYSIDEVFVDLTKVCNVRKTSVSLRVQPKQSISEDNKGLPRHPSDALGVPRNDTMVNPFEEAASIALEIKRRFKTEVGDWLRCSVGIAENKLLAKIASDFKKPNGLVIVKPFSCVIPSESDEPRNPLISEKSSDKGSLHSSDALVGRDDTGALFLSKDDLYCRLSLTDIPGIGRRQEKNLNQLGIKTLKDLRDFPKSHLTRRFGNIMGHHLYNLGQLEGSWKAAVHMEQEIKSMGHMYTLPQEFRKPEFFLPVLYKLCEMVGRRLRRKDLMGNVIHFYFHNKDYKGFGTSLKLGYFVQDGREIFMEAANFYNKLTAQKNNPVEFKLIGITVAGLRPYQNQLSLFGRTLSSQRPLLRALDKINNKYGEFTILRAQMLPAGKVFRDSIGFGRVKELN